MITIKDISTRELLAARNRPAYYADGTPRDKNLNYTFFRIGKGEITERVEVTNEELYAELETREHIPNKKEAKLLRRLQSQTGLSKEEIYAKHGAEFFQINRYPVSKKQYEWIVKVYGTEYAIRRYVIK